MDPEPLIRCNGYRRFDRGGAALRELGDCLLAVSLSLDTEGRMDLDPMLPETLSINEDRHHRRARAHGQDRQALRRRRRPAEGGHEHTPAPRGVLVQKQRPPPTPAAGAQDWP